MNDTDHLADERYMRMALEEAHRALEEDEVPIGAIVVCKGAVVGRGHSRRPDSRRQISD